MVSEWAQTVNPWGTASGEYRRKQAGERRRTSPRSTVRGCTIRPFLLALPARPYGDGSAW